MSKMPRVNRYIMLNTGSQEQRIAETLYMLDLDGIIPIFKQLAKDALLKHTAYLDFFEGLLDSQTAWKEGYRVSSQTIQAKFPLPETIED